MVLFSGPSWASNCPEGSRYDTVRVLVFVCVCVIMLRFVLMFGWRCVMMLETIHDFVV